jgi:hypothetical protein
MRKVGNVNGKWGANEEGALRVNRGGWINRVGNSLIGREEMRKK